MGYTDLGNYYISLSSLEQAKACFIESLNHAQQQSDQWGALYGLVNLAHVAYLQGDLDRAAELGEVVLAQASDYGDRQVIAGAIEQLGLVAFQQGDLNAAETHLIRAIELTRQLGQKQELPRVLVELAECMLDREPQRAARLAGAAASIRQGLAAVPVTEDTRTAARVEEALRFRLGEAEFMSALSEGQAMTFEQALECASV
jgi:tetratricopeptide (TPR) repeat protein